LDLQFKYIAEINVGEKVFEDQEEVDYENIEVIAWVIIENGILLEYLRISIHDSQISEYSDCRVKEVSKEMDDSDVS